MTYRKRRSRFVNIPMERDVFSSFLLSTSTGFSFQQRPPAAQQPRVKIQDDSHAPKSCTFVFSLSVESFQPALSHRPNRLSITNYQQPPPTTNSFQQQGWPQTGHPRTTSSVTAMHPPHKVAKRPRHPIASDSLILQAGPLLSLSAAVARL